MEYEIQEYKVGFKAIMPGYVSFGKSDLKIQDRGLVPTLPNLIRFVARHPAKKVTATTILTKECCYHQIVKSLFPDVCGGIGWSIVVGNEQVHPNDKFVVIPSIFNGTVTSLYKPLWLRNAFSMCLYHGANMCQMLIPVWNSG